MRLVFPSHILASVFISFQFLFHPLSETNQNNSSILKISLQSDGTMGSDASPETRGVDVRAQNLVPLARGPPQVEKRAGSRMDIPNQRGMDTSLPQLAWGPTKELGHLATQLSLWLTCSMVIGGHSPQGQPAQAPQSPLGVLGGLWSSEKSPWQGGGGTSGEESQNRSWREVLCSLSFFHVSVLCAFSSPPQPPSNKRGTHSNAVGLVASSLGKAGLCAGSIYLCLNSSHS